MNKNKNFIIILVRFFVPGTITGDRGNSRGTKYSRYSTVTRVENCRSLSIKEILHVT